MNRYRIMFKVSEYLEGHSVFYFTAYSERMIQSKEKISKIDPLFWSYIWRKEEV